MHNQKNNKTYHNTNAKIATNAPNALLATLRPPFAPIILIINKANQNTVSIISRIMLALRLAHRL